MMKVKMWRRLDRQYDECREGAEDHNLDVQAFFSWACQNPPHKDTNDFGFATAIAFKSSAGRSRRRARW